MLGKIYLLFSDKIKLFYSREILSAFKWSFIGQIFTRLINLIAVIILARLMLPEKYGAYTYLIGTLAFFSQVVALSIRTTSTRNVAFLLGYDKLSCEKYIKLTVIIGLILSTVGFMIICILIVLFSGASALSYYSIPLLISAALGIFSELFYGLILGVLGGLNAFKIINVITIWSNFAKFIATIIFYLLFDLEGAVLSWVGISIIIALIAFSNLSKKLSQESLQIYRHSLKSIKKEFLLFTKISVPISIEASFILISTWYIQTLVLNVPEDGKSQLAMYNVAYQWKSLAIYLPAILINLLQPFLSNFHSSGNKSEFNNIIKNTEKIVFAGSTVITIALILFSPLITKLFGKGFEQSNKILIILVIPCIFIGLSSLYRETFISRGFVWLIAIGNFIMSIINLLLFFYFKNHYSVSISFAISISIGEVFLFFFYYIIKSKYLTKYE
ncbi:oligosaccharide flippase family protein [Chryseobacterium binzhouense]|uniref:oligosaccharide flippase family protein n=1 Tax=Chryseobacterium binzhouense TaxID=2593646 RepID=UPI00117F509E|nr:oligosaccharide flippase family protein [Chryseobacterium binzhouense]